jgi:hypothetical protein
MSRITSVAVQSSADAQATEGFNFYGNDELGFVVKSVEILFNSFTSLAAAGYYDVGVIRSKAWGGFRLADDMIRFQGAIGTAIGMGSLQTREILFEPVLVDIKSVFLNVQSADFGSPCTVWCTLYGDFVKMTDLQRTQLQYIAVP